jgi:hypothetical protein
MRVRAAVGPAIPFLAWPVQDRPPRCPASRLAFMI